MEFTKFMPLVYLHSKEKYQPISIEEYITTCTAYKYISPGVPDEKNPIFPVTTDFLNQSNFEACLDSKQDWDEYKYSTPICYYATRQLEDGDTQLEFFFFLPINSGYPACGLSCLSTCEALGYHRADWENFLLILSPQGTIKKLYFSAHGSKDGYWKSPEECTFLNGRPVIYMALGAHGLYHRPDFWPRAVCIANDHTDRGKMLLDMEARPVGEWFYKRIDWRKGGTDTPTLTDESEIKEPFNTNFWRRMFCFC